MLSKLDKKETQSAAFELKEGRKADSDMLTNKEDYDCIVLSDLNKFPLSCEKD